MVLEYFLSASRVLPDNLAGDTSRTLASIISGFAISTLGTVITVTAILFGLGDKSFFRVYVKQGFFSTLLFACLITGLFQLGTFFLGAMGITSVVWVRWALAGAIVIAIQLVVMGVICFNVVRRSINEN